MVSPRRRINGVTDVPEVHSQIEGVADAKIQSSRHRHGRLEFRPQAHPEVIRRRAIAAVGRLAAFRRGAKKIYLSVFIDNRRARRFYERHGFEAVGSFAFMVGTHADEDVIMRLNL